MIPIRPELDEAVGRHAGWRPRLAIGLERTDHEPTSVMADVQVAVEIAEERQVLRGCWRLLGHDPHMLGGVERDARIDQPGQLGGPETGRQDDDLGLDVAGARRDPGHATGIRATAEPRDRRPGHVADPAVHSGTGQRKRGGPRVDGPVVRKEHTADEVVDVHGRPERADPLAIDDLGGQPGIPRDGDRPADLAEPLIGPGDGQRPDPAKTWVDAGLAADPLVRVDIDP